jgi:hypothetical protein
MINKGLIQVQKFISFEEWVEGGFSNETGRLEILFRGLGFGIIQPDRFRERRLLVLQTAIAAPTGKDSQTQRYLSPQTGSQVEFDMEPQAFHKSQLPQVSACRLLLPKGKK